MALTPENRPAWQTRGDLQPANTIQPMVGVYYDAAGIPHQAYIAAFQNAAGQPIAPPGSVAPSAFTTITKSDTTDVTGIQAVYVGGTGNLIVKGTDGVQVTFTAVPVGTTIRGQFSRIMAATTATLLVGMT